LYWYSDKAIRVVLFGYGVTPGTLGATLQPDKDERNEQRQNHIARFFHGSLLQKSNASRFLNDFSCRLYYVSQC
jgi:hypothetical protein